MVVDTLTRKFNVQNILHPATEELEYNKADEDISTA
jgi:hypothetical protein